MSGFEIGDEVIHSGITKGRVVALGVGSSLNYVKVRRHFNGSEYWDKITYWDHNPLFSKQEVDF